MREAVVESYLLFGGLYLVVKRNAKDVALHVMLLTGALVWMCILIVLVGYLLGG